jgi:hypothetical protein
VRLKSSFIYLANAVNDLRGNWALLTALLAPMVLAVSLCLLPEAVNLQHRLAMTFEGHPQNISYFLAQTPYPAPSAEASISDPFPTWSIWVLAGVAALLVILTGLLVLVALRRMESGARATTLAGEVFEVYRQSLWLTPAYLWIAFLKLIPPVIAGFGLGISVNTPYAWVYGMVGIGKVALVAAGAIVYLWVYLAPYALVYDGRHSFHALLFSRDLLRKRFFSVAIRIAVFLAVLSGYNSWGFGAFIVASMLLTAVAAMTGLVWSMVMLMNIASFSVTFATTAFFIAASARMYKDLLVGMPEQAARPAATPLTPTAPLADAQS